MRFIDVPTDLGLSFVFHLSSVRKRYGGEHCNPYRFRYSYVPFEALGAAIMAEGKDPRGFWYAHCVQSQLLFWRFDGDTGWTDRPSNKRMS